MTQYVFKIAQLRDSVLDLQIATTATMCQPQDPDSTTGVDGAAGDNHEDDRPRDTEQDLEPFPWHLGIYDAHCHPTDSMHGIPSLPNMKARVLTIMSTRFQDQDLVSKVANEYGYDGKSTTHPGAKIIPSFGYHPWFSHLIYDDLKIPSSSPPTREEHYNTVLTSSPIDPSLANSLPEPRPLSKLLSQTKSNLLSHSTALLGEVGLDRTFRIPHPTTSSPTGRPTENLTPGTHHSHPLTKHRVQSSHQIAILQAQLRLAGELGRPASVHVVGGQGLAFEAMKDLWKGYEKYVPTARDRKIAYRKKGETAPAVELEDEPSPTATGSKPFPPRICLHSFSGPPETVSQYLHPSIPVEFYFSFSEVINFSLPEHQRGGGTGMDSASARALAALKVVPEDRILVESDIHICGDRMDGLLEGIVRRVCDARGWGLEDGVRRLGRNWRMFVFGSEDGG